MVEIQRIDPADWLNRAQALQSEGLSTLMGLDRLSTNEFEIWLRTEQGTQIFMSIPRDGSVEVPSVCSVWPEADWREREIHEMFGITFDRPLSQKPFLIAPSSPIFQSYPLRRDQLLVSRNETPWPGAKDPADAAKSPSRRKSLPVGVDPDWSAKRGEAL
jgi:NADH-quinone oxidoreductase subunit C